MAKNPWKLIYILAKQRRYSFNLINFCKKKNEIRICKCNFDDFWRENATRSQIGESTEGLQEQEQQEYKDVEKDGFDVAFWRENCYSKWGVGILVLHEKSQELNYGLPGY